MHFPSFLLLTALFASSSVLAAHDDQHSRSSTHARHRRLANKQRAQPVDDRAVLPAVDLGVLPAGPTKMRKRSCRAKTTSNSTLAVSAAVLSPSTASPASPSSTQVVKGLVGGITGGATSIVGDVASVVSSVLSPATSTSSSAQAVATKSSSSLSSASSWTPNGKKAGIAGGDSYKWMEPYIGSWYDWSATPPQQGTPLAIPMLWGGGSADGTDASRLAAFKAITSPPKFILGFEEPDCAAGSGSAGMSIDSGAALWNQLVAPLGEKGSILFSPSMCKQADEEWLTPFQKKINRDWDITSIHVNKNSMAGVKKDLDYYWNTYKKPISVSEFACVDDSNGFTPCTNQAEIDKYINEIVPLLEADSRVISYYYSDGYGLGSVWPTVFNGKLSASGQTYLDAISKFH